jgi:hypothetical protein
MRPKMRIMGMLMVAALIYCGCSTQSGATRGADSGVSDSRPCVANITSEGSFLSSRTIRTFQDFSNVTRSAAFDQIIAALATAAMTVASSSKEAGVITSYAKPNYSKGETESLNVVVRDKGAAGIRVELTYIAPALAVVNESGLHEGFCKIMADVESAKK